MKAQILTLIIFLGLGNLWAGNEVVYLNSAREKENKVEVLQTDENSIELSVTINSYSLSQVKINGQTFAIVHTNKDTRILEKGAPDLPKFSRSVIIPGKGKSSLQVTPGSFIEIKDIDVAPSKGLLYRDINPSDVPYEFGKVYQSNAFYPSDLAFVRDPYILREYRGQAVVFTPFQYNPVSRVLRIYTDFKVEISFNTNENGINELSSNRTLNKSNKEFQNIYKQHFLNFPQQRYTPVGEDGDMLIICHPDFMEAMEPFVAWKIQKGIQTTIVDVSTIGNSTAIKTYIQNFYTNNNLSYVLLVGDASFVPSFSASSGDSDNSYGYLSGNDSYPEVFVGRFSAETVPHVNTMVDRTLEYELNPNTGTYYEHNIGIGSSQGPGDDNEMDFEHIRNQLTDLNNFTYTSGAEFFDGSQGGLDASGNPTASMVASEVNTGAGIILYTGHGSTTSFGTSGMSNTQVNALTNNGKYPFIWSVACVNGNFVNSTCFAEAWLRATNNNSPAGAIATLMSTINQSWNPPMCGQDEMTDILVESYTNNIKRSFGAISLNGCMQMNDEYGSGGDQMTDTWNCFGDPSVIVRTAQPQTLTATHDPTAFLGSTSFMINCPVNDALISLTQGSQIVSKATVSNGIANLSFPSLTTIGSLTLTITAFNYIPYVAQIDIIPNNGPYVTMQNCAVNDLASGNQNQAADFNETIALNFDLNNIGIVTALNVVGTLSTNDPVVTIVNDTYNFGDINASNIVSQSAIFEIQTASDVEDQHVAPMELTLVDDSAHTWVTYFNLVINAPELSLVFDHIDDSGQGNNNGRLDPGETVDLVVIADNIGHANIGPGLCNLVCTNPDITITQASISTSGLDINSPQTLLFELNISTTAAMGTLAEFNMDLSSGAYADSESSTQKIGLIAEDWESNTFTTFTWENDATYPWVILNNNAYEGSNLAKSGTIDNNQHSDLSITIDVLDDDSISFYRKVSCEDGGGYFYDYLEFLIDNVSKGKWDGEKDWEQEKFAISAGTHTLKWTYKKDGYYTEGSDCAWIDFIEFPAIDINYAPFFITPGDSVSVSYMWPINIDVQAYDQNAGDPIFLNCSSLPTFLNFTDNGDGTGLISGTAYQQDQGFYNIVLSVSDGIAPIVNHDLVLEITYLAGIDETNADSKIQVFPNPCQDQLNLQIPSNTNVEAIQVLDINGKILRLIDLNHQSRSQYLIPVNNLENGLYFIRVMTPESNYLEKFILIK